MRNRAQESGGAVYAKDSKIIIRSGQKLSIVENKGYDGGAITLTGDSIIYLEANSSVVFASNHAYHYGGAIYYVDEYTKDFGPETELSKCFYGILTTEVAFTKDLRGIYSSIHFYNNTAGFAGTAIYGGWIDTCKFRIILSKYSILCYQNSLFDSLFHFHQPTQQLSLISSGPTRVCLCTNMSIPDCSITEYTITAYPGETLTIPAVAVGQRFGTVPSTVQSSFVSGSNGRLPALQYTQLVNANCTNLVYTIHSVPNRTEVMELTVEKRSFPQNRIINKRLNNFRVNRTIINLQFSELTINIKVQLCPLGFVSNDKTWTCTCHPKLQQYAINCSIDTQTVYRRSPLWIKCNISQ